MSGWVHGFVGHAPLIGAVLLVAAHPAAAQDNRPVAPEAVVTPPVYMPPSEPGPPGVIFGAIARTPGVPLVLQSVTGTATRPLAAVVVENTSGQPLTAIALAVTWIPADGQARRRVVGVPIAIEAGAVARVQIAEVAALPRLEGITGTLEVAPAGARAADGTVWEESPGPVWTTRATTLACGDDDWQPRAVGLEQPDATTGTIVRCEADGRWRAVRAEGR